MKPVFWQKVAVSGISGSVWECPEIQLDFTKVLDVPDLEKYFAEPPKKNKKKGGDAPPKPQKPAIVSVLDGKRTQGIGIFCQRAKLPDEEIVKRILCCHESFMNEEDIGNLVVNMPSPEEFADCSNFSGDLKYLARPDHFVRAVGKIPRLKQRVAVMAIMVEFAEKVNDTKPLLETVLVCLDQLRNSPKVKKILELMLGVGNYCNGGGSKGGAFGFKIQLLEKAVEVKSYDPKVSLLHYVVNSAEDKDPTIKEWVHDLASLEAAAKVNTDAIDNNLKDMERMVNTALAELEASGAPFNEHDVFKSRLQDWIEGAQSSQKACVSIYEKYAAVLAEVIGFFCEDRRCSAEDFFGLWERFRGLYKVAAEENEMMRVLESKRAAILAKKAAKEAKKNGGAVPAKEQAKVADKKAVGNLLDSIAPSKGKGKGKGKGK
eukprot:TRINITY_DN3814_c0_g1_i1.p1 TRINITY_DN3814_c0_g1~~TRINITY_DN3814_c0_g1_i1.p1  ORF type:complete len:432 (-),score=156.76 TRINITY_DN3814_c0_g1_i1:45-1340(-)